MAVKTKQNNVVKTSERDFPQPAALQLLWLKDIFKVNSVLAYLFSLFIYLSYLLGKCFQVLRCWKQCLRCVAVRESFAQYEKEPHR